MTIHVQIKTVYGKELIYPCCDTSKLLVALTGAKTFTRKDIDVIKALGYSIEVVQQVTKL